MHQKVKCLIDIYFSHSCNVLIISLRLLSYTYGVRRILRAACEKYKFIAPSPPPHHQLSFMISRIILRKFYFLKMLFLI